MRSGADRWTLSDADSALPASISGASEKAGEALRRYPVSSCSDSSTLKHESADCMLACAMCQSSHSQVIDSKSWRLIGETVVRKVACPPANRSSLRTCGFVFAERNI